MHIRYPIFVFIIALSVTSGVVWAVSTKSFDIDNAAALSAGELDGTAVYSEGLVAPSASTQRFALKDTSIAYSIARGKDDSLYIGTGHEGKIFRYKHDKVTLFSNTKQLLTSSLVIDDRGVLYAGTLPEARIFKIDANGEASEFVRLPGAQHIWSMVYEFKTRRIFVATGPEGKIFTVSERGKADVYYDSDASQIMSLARDDHGALYAGTGDKAVLLKITQRGQASVVYDFPGTEVTAMHWRQGRLGVVVNEFGSQSSSAFSLPLPSIIKSNDPKIINIFDRLSPGRAMGGSAGKGRVWTIDTDGRVEQVYASDDMHFTSIEMAADGTVFVGAAKEGRIFKVNRDRTYAVWADADERQVSALSVTSTNPLFVTSDAAALYRVNSPHRKPHLWTSKVLDARFRSMWGQLTWRGTGTIRFQTRSGNVEKPDATWSTWSEAITTPSHIKSPPARFIQVRATLEPNQKTMLRAVSIFYLPQNQRAYPGEITAKSATAEDPTRGMFKQKLGWKVDNPDGDRLRYRVQFRMETQPIWRNVIPEEEKLTNTEYTWDTSGVPDGYYIIKVEASDEFANPSKLALKASSTSEPILVDNHAPHVLNLRYSGTTLSGRVFDSIGPISRLEYSVDGGQWQMFFPSDGLLDTRDEPFNLSLPVTKHSPHVLAVRAADAAGNTNSAEVTVK